MTTPARTGLLQRIAHALFGEPLTRELLLEKLEDARAHSVFDAGTLTMIEGVLRISELQVRDVMVARSQMVVVRRADDLAGMVAVVASSGHSRYPVIGDHRDEVLGILLAKDLLAYLEPGKEVGFSLRDVLRPAVFVPESKRLDVLLWEFRVGRNHMAVVVDEYGGIAGLVTIEDVLEQIVGEIEDEYDVDEDESFVEELDDGRFRVSGLTPVETFNARFGAGFSDTEFDTVGGLVAHLFGQVPETGAHAAHDGFEFTVLHASRRRIESLEVRREPRPEVSDG